LIAIHPASRVSRLADIVNSARGARILVGAGAVIDSFVKFKPAGGNCGVEIGSDCFIVAAGVPNTGNRIRWARA
jgi:virginiamycin A acetyltransferase